MNCSATRHHFGYTWEKNPYRYCSARRRGTMTYVLRSPENNGYQVFINRKYHAELIWGREKDKNPNQFAGFGSKLKFFQCLFNVSEKNLQIFDCLQAFMSDPNQDSHQAFQKGLLCLMIMLQYMPICNPLLTSADQCDRNF